VVIVEGVVVGGEVIGVGLSDGRALSSSAIQGSALTSRGGLVLLSSSLSLLLGGRGEL